jgi:type II secretory pathway pseudopilin PulG
MTLIEIIVVMALLVGLMAVAIPAYQAVFDVNMRAAAKELAQTYKWLQDEAAMRNVTFRVAIDLDQGTWKVEAGDPSTLIFSTPEERETAEKDLESTMRRYTERELAEDAEAQEEIAAKSGGKFTGLDDVTFTTQRALPTNVRFEWVYTPQYGEEGKEPTKGGPPQDPLEDSIAYTHVFPDGTSEHTVVRIVDADDPEDGWTIEVEPLTGKVNLEPDLMDPAESLSWLPDEGPTFE